MKRHKGECSSTGCLLALPYGTGLSNPGWAGEGKGREGRAGREQRGEGKK